MAMPVLESRTKLAAIDRVSIVLIAAGALFVAYVSADDLFWLVVASVICAVYAWRTSDGELLKICCFGPVAYSFGFMGARAYLLHCHLRLLDDQFAAMDGGFSVGVWRWTQHHWPLGAFLAVVYFAMGAEVLATFVISDRRKEFLRALLLASIGSVVLYRIFPAVGPFCIGQKNAFPNAFPSMHMGFALLCVVYVAPQWRLKAGIFAALVAFATLGLGAHYLLDVIAAFPFVALVCMATNYSMAPGKRRAIAPADIAIRPSPLP